MIKPALQSFFFSSPTCFFHLSINLNRPSELIFFLRVVTNLTFIKKELLFDLKGCKMEQHRVEKNKKSLSKIFVLFVAIVSFTAAFSGCTNTPLDKDAGGLPSVDSWTGWSKYNDNHGFSTYIPAGWSVDVDDGGLIRIGENPTGNAGDMVFIWTMALNEQKTEAVLFDETVVLLQNFIPGLQVTSERYVSNYSVYVGTMSYGDYIGVLMLSINGTDAYFTGLAAKEDQYNASLDKLIRVLYSFNYEPQLMDPDDVGIVQMGTWTDPREGAFTINIPTGWTISSDSGITRTYLDAAVKIVVSKDDLGISIEQLHPPLYYTPNWVLDMSGFTEGSSYGGGIVMSYHNAEQYAEGLLADELGLDAPTDVIDRSDLLSKIYAAPWIQEKTAAEATFENGAVHKVLIGDEYYELSGIGMWAVSMIHYWAPEDDLELVAKIANEMMLSFVLNATWAENEQIQVAARVGIINQMGDDIAKIVKSTFEYRDQVMDDASTKFSNAILGVEDVYDPETGQHWTVPAGSSSYWRDVYGNVYGSGSYAPPTYSDNWKELICPNC
jgi:hypothetical protein